MGCRVRRSLPSIHVNEGTWFWPWRYPQLVAVKSRQGKLRKVDGEPTVVLGQQAHLLAPENFAQKHVVLLPTKMTMWPHTAYQHALRVVRFRHARRKPARRRLIDRRRRLHLQRFVGTHLIVFLAKTVQRPLLLAPVGRRRLSRLLLQRAIHALVPALLLRMSPIDPFRHDPQLDPPHRPPRQPGHRPRSKRRAVIGADGLRHAVLAEA